MFDLLDRPLIWIPVKWAGLAPGIDVDKVAIEVEHRIELQVEILDRPEFLAWSQRRGTGDDDFPGELEMFKVVASNWRKVVAGNKAVPFTDENVIKLLARPGFVTAFGAAYMKAWSGRAEEREGNSDALPPAGQADGATSGTVAEPIPPS